MKGEQLFEAVGLVDDRLVEEAADAGRSGTPWKKLLPIAACLVVTLSLGSLTAGVLLRGCGSADPSVNNAESSDSAAPADSGSMEKMEDAAEAAVEGAGDVQSSAGAEPASPEEMPFLPSATEAPPESAPAGTDTAGDSEKTGEPAPEPEATAPEPAVTLLTLSTGDDTNLTIRRLELAGRSGAVLDRYTVKNEMGEARTAWFYYPVAESGEPCGLEAVRDGTAVPVEVVDKTMPEELAQLLNPVQDTVQVVYYALETTIPAHSDVTLEFRFERPANSVYEGFPTE